jgi:hypothetical protein
VKSISDISRNQNYLATQLPAISENNEISIYKGELSDQIVKDQVGKLKTCFPDLPANWFSILIDRVKDSNFTDSRLIAAVNNCIDSFVYGKQPNIANVLSYDKTVKLLNYGQFTEKINSGERSSDYIAVDVGAAKPKFVHVTDYEKTGLEKFTPKK